MQDQLNLSGDDLHLVVPSALPMQFYNDEQGVMLGGTLADWALTAGSAGNLAHLSVKVVEGRIRGQINAVEFDSDLAGLAAVIEVDVAKLTQKPSGKVATNRIDVVSVNASGNPLSVEEQAAFSALFQASMTADLAKFAIAFGQPL